MWGVLILLAASLSAEAYSSYNHGYNERLAHGRQLKIHLLEKAEKLEFIPVNNPTDRSLCWKKSMFRTPRGRVSGTGRNMYWYIDKVTFKDEGTYVQTDFWNKDISMIDIAVTSKQNYVKRVAGESLHIQLEGIDIADAFLSFSGSAANVTLVRDGAPVAQDHPDYWDRVKTHSRDIEIRHVNTSDEGHYILKDRRDRVVSITRMDLTEHHDYQGGNPLMALLLLLGIPAGICCCCRKKIFKKKATTETTQQSLPEIVHTPPAGPAGPCPPYSTPGHPGEGHYQGPNPNMGPTVHPPPSPGFNPAYPPQNPSYPPQNPSYPPQNPSYPPQNPSYPPQNPSYPPQNPSYPPQNPSYPPQNPSYPPAGYAPPPQNQYPPAAMGPPNYGPAPVMYSAPPPAATDPVKEPNMEKVASPVDPLLTAAPQAVPGSDPGPPSSTSVLNTSDGAALFQIDGRNNSTNFL